MYILKSHQSVNKKKLNIVHLTDKSCALCQISQKTTSLYIDKDVPLTELREDDPLTELSDINKS